MATIKVNDLHDAMEVEVKEAADVKGGPVYMKFDGIKGSVTGSAYAGGVRVAVGDVNGDS